MTCDSYRNIFDPILKIVQEIGLPCHTLLFIEFAEHLLAVSVIVSVALKPQLTIRSIICYSSILGVIGSFAQNISEIFRNGLLLIIHAIYQFYIIFFLGKGVQVDSNYPQISEGISEKGVWLMQNLWRSEFFQKQIVIVFFLISNSKFFNGRNGEDV